MDNQNRKIIQPKFFSITAMIILGVFVAIVVYQAQVNGLFASIPKFNKSSNQTLQMRTVVQEENAIISAVEKSADAVVAIAVAKDDDDPMDPFADPQKQDTTIGTGFVVDSSGVIVTNKHVVGKVGVYNVVMNSGIKYQVRDIYRDSVLDLAILKISADNLPKLMLGDSSKIKVGQTVIAIGNALGKYTNTVTMGIVSGLGRSVVTGDFYSSTIQNMDNLIQTDAAINPGNSGGPILDSAGYVIGVSVSSTEGAQNIGFAVPINVVRSVVDEYIQKGTIIRPYIGIKYRYITPEVSTLSNVSSGAYIQGIDKGSPAEVAGLKTGDIITKINDTVIDSENKLGEVISKVAIGSTLEVTVARGGQLGKLKMKVIEAAKER